MSSAKITNGKGTVKVTCGDGSAKVNCSEKQLAGTLCELMMFSVEVTPYSQRLFLL